MEEKFRHMVWSFLVHTSLLKIFFTEDTKAIQSNIKTKLNLEIIYKRDQETKQRNLGLELDSVLK